MDMGMGKTIGSPIAFEISAHFAPVKSAPGYFE
jgi:hypothetical protein